MFSLWSAFYPLRIYVTLSYMLSTKYLRYLLDCSYTLIVSVTLLVGIHVIICYPLGQEKLFYDVF
jgi:hypothetical protein